MALTAEQIQQMSNAGGGQDLYNMVRNGQLPAADVRAALGDDAVNAFLTRTQQVEPVPTSMGPPTDYGNGAPPFQLGGGSLFNLTPSAPPTYTPPPSPAPT
jgi:hypothetical protein